MKIEIQKITVGPRMRVDYGDLDDLANSMSRLGQLQPIILDSDGELIAGERRLKAAMMLGWQEIEGIYKENLDEIGRKEIELEENLRRKDFTWPEEVLALEKLYNLKVERYGTRTSGTDGSTGYGIKDAVDEMERSAGTISESLQLAKALRQFPDIAFEKTKSAAFKQWKRKREHMIRMEQAKRRSAEMHKDEPVDDTGGGSLDDMILPAGVKVAPQQAQITGESKPVEPLVKKAGFKGYGIQYRGDAEFVLRHMEDAIIDCIVTDPPYALAMFKGEGQTTSGRRLAEHQGAMYDDDPHKVLDKFEKVVAQCARVLKPKGHAYFFFHHNWYQEILNILHLHFQDAVEATPIIWVKNTSGIGDPTQRWVYSYEPFFFVNRGRTLAKAQGHNYIITNTVPPGQKTHPTEKPTMLLRQIIQASCVANEVVLDPYAGSGSTIVAALESGCKFYGIELDDAYYQRICDRIALTIGTMESQPQAAADDSSSA